MTKDEGLNLQIGELIYRVLKDNYDRYILREYKVIGRIEYVKGSNIKYVIRDVHALKDYDIDCINIVEYQKSVKDCVDELIGIYDDKIKVLEKLKLEARKLLLKDYPYNR